MIWGYQVEKKEGVYLENIEEIVAVMAIKTYPADEVGTLRKVGESDEGLIAGLTPDQDVGFFTLSLIHI